jgi:hypothetical protein
MSASSPSGPPGTEPSAAAAAPAPTPATAPPPGNAASAHAAHGDEPHLHPEHFVLSPEVARLPLARRRQRLGAILVDLALVAVLTRAFSSLGLLAGAFAGTLLYWAAGRPFAPAWMRRKSARIALAFALCLGFIVVGRLLAHERSDAEEAQGDKAADAITRAAVKASKSKGAQGLNFQSLGLGGGELLELATTKDPERARGLAQKLEASVKAKPDSAETAKGLMEVVNDEDLPLSEVARTELLRVLLPLAQPQAPAGETVGTAPAAQAEVDPHIQELAALQARNAALRTQVEQYDERVDALEDELEEAHKEHGIMDFIKASVHDVGFGIGWSYVYFIGFLVLWKGHTPGKRLFGIRVLRIDGKPMTLWRSFERFHGYAASLLTGLLGFLQVLWDPSRQCLHDKVAETVVVQDRHHSTDAVVR